jgi:hypothetical protein
MNSTERPAVAGPVEPTVGPHLPPHTWHWVQFETMAGIRAEPQPALWNGRHWHSVGWTGIPLDGVVLCGPCSRPGKPVAWRVDGPCLSGRIGGDIWHRAPTADDVRCWTQLGIADRITVQCLYALVAPTTAV